MDKNQVANILEEVGALLELKEGTNPFEVRAYQNAARAVNSLDGDIEQLTREGKLKSVPGLGSTIIKRIEELVNRLLPERSSPEDRPVIELPQRGHPAEVEAFEVEGVQERLLDEAAG